MVEAPLLISPRGDEEEVLKLRIFAASTAVANDVVETNEAGYVLLDGEPICLDDLFPPNGRARSTREGVSEPGYLKQRRRGSLRVPSRRR